MFNDRELADLYGESATVSKLDWFLLSVLSYVLSLIPSVGIIAQPIFYLFLVVKRNTAPSIKNYLILMLIQSVIITTIFLWLLLAAHTNPILVSIQNAMLQVIKGGPIDV